jgi:SAM-dependent methyltransferase
MKKVQVLLRGRRILGLGKGYLLSVFAQARNSLAYNGLIPSGWGERLITRFWESSAEAIHGQWGSGRDDYLVLGKILDRYHPLTLLDVGCGSGRLFPLYAEKGITDFVGVDISEKALAIARDSFPDADLRRQGLIDLDFADDFFDLCVCNRVLQHVPEKDIHKVVQNLSRIGRIVYINELSESDEQNEVYFMKNYNYQLLFNKNGLDCLEKGSIGDQTYCVFGRRGNAVLNRQVSL